MHLAHFLCSFLLGSNSLSLVKLLPKNGIPLYFQFTVIGKLYGNYHRNTRQGGRTRQGNGFALQGALLPAEALTLLQEAPDAKLVDVRSRAELDWVGRIPGAVEIEWQSYPGMRHNPDFLELSFQPGGQGIAGDVYLPQRGTLASGRRDCHRIGLYELL